VSPQDVRFPLAAGIAALVEPQVPDLLAGRDPELLEQVTDTTAQLLRF